MLVTPLPAVNRDDLLKTLRETASDLTNASNTSGARKRLMAYLEWVARSVRMLEGRVSAANLDRLVLTPGYGRLLSAAGSLAGDDTGSQRVLNGMLDQEVRQRGRMLEDAIRDLDNQITRWPETSFVTVADTSIYLEHEHKLEDLDFAALLPGWKDKTVRVIVPIIILDELDGLKRSGDAHRRWRAGYTLSVMEKAFAAEQVPGLLREPTRNRDRGGVILDLLFDPPGHVRLPINDDEIIDRALAAQSLAGTRLTLLTFDTSQAARARNAGLPVSKLTIPIGEEPADTRGRKAKQAPAEGNSGRTAASWSPDPSPVPGRSLSCRPGSLKCLAARSPTSSCSAACRPPPPGSSRRGRRRRPPRWRAPRLRGSPGPWCAGITSMILPRTQTPSSSPAYPPPCPCGRPRPGGPCGGCSG